MLDQYPDVVTPSDLAGILHIGRNKTYHLIAEGQIRVIKIGKSIRIPKTSVIEYLNSACKHNDGELLECNHRKA